MEAQKPNDLVEKLLGEEGDLPPGSPGRMARGTSTNAAGEQVAGDFEGDEVYRQRQAMAASAASMDDDDEEEEDDDSDNEFEFESETHFRQQLGEMIEENMPGVRISSFEEAGVLTRNEGLIVSTQNGGRFQITIVEDRGRY